MNFLFLLLVVPLVSGDKVVITKSGPVKGTPVAEKKVHAFLSIPYAEPPLGSLRFAKPVPKSPWEETYIADQLPPSCVQGIPKGFDFPMGNNKITEDCLYLNVWVPENGQSQKPVMVFIHGGAFMFGTSNLKVYDGATLSRQGDVIVATINYRVGTLGFFSAFTDGAPGSIGMYDQIMALQWIKDNAKNFGGDPDNIVIFGESAGGFSVSLHMVSPLSRNLFNRAIPQSGTGFHPMYSDNNEALFKGSQLIARMLGCADDNKDLKKHPEAVVECMKSVPAEKIAETDGVYFLTNGMLFPRVGDDFLPDNPIDSFRRGEFKDSDLLLGVTRDEGSLLLPLFKPDLFDVLGRKVDERTFNETSAKEILLSITKVEDENIFQSYLDRVKDGSRYTYLNAMSDALGDFLITCGAVFQADYHSQNGNQVYFYLFDYRSPSSPYAEWMGVAHFDEVKYVFGNPFLSEFSEIEKEFSKDIMDMWVAFAKTGNPTIPGGLKWPTYTSENPKYFIIGQRDSLGVRPDNYRCERWRNAFGAAE